MVAELLLVSATGQPVHVCRGCCGSLQETLERAQVLVEDAVVCPLPAPALNKWTKLGPTIAKVVFMSHFCGVLSHCLRREFGKLEEQEEENAAGSDGEAAAAAAGVGLPLDERAEWRRVANQRRLKTVQFLEDPEAAFYNLLWLVIAAPILTLHWQLFKHAKWVSERVPGAEEGHIIKRFCNPACNPAAAVIVSLLNILVNARALDVVCFFHGSLQAWSAARKLAVQQLVLVACGQLWRKLVAPWSCYPWRLWPLAFSSDGAERRQAVDELLAQRDCCLDQCFSRKLRTFAQDAEALVGMQPFVCGCFTRVVATSTFVERRFAAYGAWCSRRGGLPRLATLAGKHVTSCLKDFVEHWRRQNTASKSSSRSRPAWVADRVTKRQTGLHIFCSERAHAVGGSLSGGNATVLANFLQESRRQWQDVLSADERAQYSRLAKERNAFSAAQDKAQESCQVTGGPWQLALLDDRWPLRSDLLAAAMQSATRQELVDAWKVKYSTAEEELPNSSLPGEKDVHLFGACLQGGCEADLTDNQREALRRLQLSLATLVRCFYPQAGQLGSGALLLRVRPVGAGRPAAKTVAVCFATRTNPPESVLLELRGPQGASGSASCTLALPSPAEAAQFCSDTVFCVRLARVATDWTFSVLRLGDPGGSLDRFVVLGEEPFSQEDLDKKRQENMLQEAALRAAKQANCRRRPKNRKQTPRTAKAGKKPSGSKRKRCQEVASEADGSVSAAETQVAEASDHDSALTWSDVEAMQDEAVASPVTSGAAASAAPSREEPAEEAAASKQLAARGAGGSQPGRGHQHRAQQWGPFSISKIVRSRDGLVTGWGAICGLHGDHSMEGERVSSTQCKKAFSCAARSQQECVLLLKRWLLLGLLQQDEWPAHRKRSTHVHLPLERLQQGPSEGEMDQWMQDFMRRAHAASRGDSG